MSIKPWLRYSYILCVRALFLTTSLNFPTLLFFVLFCFVFSSEYESMNKPQYFFSHTGTIYEFTGNFMGEVGQITIVRIMV